MMKSVSTCVAVFWCGCGKKKGDAEKVLCRLVPSGLLHSHHSTPDRIPTTMTTFAARTLSFPSRAVSPLYFGNASTTDAGIELTPSARYQSGAAYLRDAWPMSAFGRYGGFDMSLTVLFDEQSGFGLAGLAHKGCL